MNIGRATCKNIGRKWASCFIRHTSAPRRLSGPAPTDSQNRSFGVILHLCPLRPSSCASSIRHQTSVAEHALRSIGSRHRHVSNGNMNGTWTITSVDQSLIYRQQVRQVVKFSKATKEQLDLIVHVLRKASIRCARSGGTVTIPDTHAELYPLRAQQRNRLWLSRPTNFCSCPFFFKSLFSFFFFSSSFCKTARQVVSIHNPSMPDKKYRAGARLTPKWARRPFIITAKIRFGIVVTKEGALKKREMLML